MQCKTLIHKTLPDIYGHPVNFPVEFAHGEIPMLQPMTATMEFMHKHYKHFPEALKQLNDYNLVTVNVSPVITGIDVAKALFTIHHHEEKPNETIIVYKEDELIPVLIKLGLPAPDWNGWNKELHANTP